MEEAEELTGGIEFATDLFLPATADRMARHLEVPPACPSELVNPELKLSALDMFWCGDESSVSDE